MYVCCEHVSVKGFSGSGEGLGFGIVNLLEVRLAEMRTKVI